MRAAENDPCMASCFETHRSAGELVLHALVGAARLLSMRPGEVLVRRGS
jgi:hypothetical protein